MSDNNVICQVCMGTGTIMVMHPLLGYFRPNNCPGCAAPIGGTLTTVSNGPGVGDFIIAQTSIPTVLPVLSIDERDVADQAIAAWHDHFGRLVPTPEHAIVDPIGLANPPLVVSDGVLPEASQCIDVTPTLTIADINAQQAASDLMFAHQAIGACALCDIPVLGTKAYGPIGAGHLTMSFGYNSRHDILALDGFICDDCADRFHERMIAPTQERLRQRRQELEAEGVQFATDDDLKDI